MNVALTAQPCGGLAMSNIHGFDITPQQGFNILSDKFVKRTKEMNELVQVTKRTYFLRKQKAQNESDVGLYKINNGECHKYDIYIP